MVYILHIHMETFLGCMKRRVGLATTVVHGRDTRHLVWCKSPRQYTTEFPLTLLIAFHMIQYQRIY